MKKINYYSSKKYISTLFVTFLDTGCFQFSTNKTIKLWKLVLTIQKIKS